MRFLRLLHLDLKEGFRSFRAWWALAAVVPLALCATLFMTAGHEEVAARLCFGDYVAHLFLGLRPDAMAASGLTELPLQWLVIMLLPLFLVLGYPVASLGTGGLHALLASRSRILWWLSKAAWTAISVSAAYGLMLAVAFVWTLITGGAGENVAHEAAFVVGRQGDRDMRVGMQIASLEVTVLFAFISMALVQMTVSLVANPLIGFVTSALFVFCSGYLSVPWLPGEYAMAARSSLFFAGGREWSAGVLVTSGFAVIAVVLGTICFAHKDLMEGRSRD